MLPRKRPGEKSNPIGEGSLVLEQSFRELLTTLDKQITQA